MSDDLLNLYECDIGRLYDFVEQVDDELNRMGLLGDVFYQIDNAGKALLNGMTAKEYVDSLGSI